MEAERPSNPPRNAGLPDKQGPPTIPCTYENCPRLFYTKEALRVHKQSDPSHPYCFKCKADFRSRGELFLHKLSSPKHHACPICSMDFRSRSGRDFHIRSNHQPEQNIECTGCGTFFKAAAALIKHIECNECSEIHTSRMLLEQHRREQVHAGLHELAKIGPMTGSFEPLPSNPVTVPVPTINQSTPAPTKKRDDDPPLIEFSSDSEDSPEDIKKTPTTTTDKDQKEKEKEKEKEKGKGKGKKKGTLPLRIASQNMRHLTLEEVFLPSLRYDGTGFPISIDAVFPSGPNDLISFEHVADDSVSSGAYSDGYGNFGLPLMPISELLRDRLPGWESDVYFDTDKGEFVCACGWSTAYVTEFEYHVAMEKRWITVTQCPECGKVFSSTAALVAHMEQVRNRCRIRDTKDFARIMGDVTGGLVQIRGELPNGGDRIIARQIAEPMLPQHGAGL